MEIYVWYEDGLWPDHRIRIGTVLIVKETAKSYILERGAGNDLSLYGSRIDKDNIYVAKTFKACRQKAIAFFNYQITKVKTKLEVLEKTLATLPAQEPVKN